MWLLITSNRSRLFSREFLENELTVLRYQQLLGCDNVNLTNTTNFYARYTTSVICNSIVQQSIQPCSLSTSDARPLCAETCVSNSLVLLGNTLTLSRLNKQRAKRQLQSTTSFVADLTKISLIRFEPISPTVHYQATHSAQRVSREERMNQMNADLPPISRDYAATVRPAHRMPRTRVV